jgi:hypothetical protein
MRHKERTQLGVALCAVLLCLTSTIAGFPHGKHTVSLANSAVRLSAVCPVDAKTDIRVVLYKGLTTDNPVLTVTNLDKPTFVKLATGINDATLQNTARDPLQHVLVFYKRAGVVDRRFYITSTGLLYEPVHSRFFRPDSSASAFISRHLGGDNPVHWRWWF